MKKFLIVICLIIGIGIVCEFGFNSYNPYETKCVEAGCNNDRVEGSIYCKEHKPSEKDITEETTKETTTYYYHNSSSSSSYSNSSSSYGGSSSYSNSSSSSTGGYSSYSSGSSSSSPYKSYDEGYEAVYDDDDYDWDRYNSDSDYAEGVDDALDELDD